MNAASHQSYVRCRLIAAVIFLFGAHYIMAQSAAPNASEISTAVERFHRALAQGDRAATLELLAPDALVLESGEAQTRPEYEREHLGEDIAFAKTTKTERSQIKVEQQGDTAWATATSKTTGTFNGRKIDSVGVELMVLTKGDAGWRIRAIHWSNRKAE
jgi:ketosteroid isomerase-like protein